MDNILIKFVVDAKLSVLVNTLGDGIRLCKGSHGLAWGVTSSQRKFNAQRANCKVAGEGYINISKFAPWKVD